MPIHTSIEVIIKISTDNKSGTGPKMENKKLRALKHTEI